MRYVGDLGLAKAEQFTKDFYTGTFRLTPPLLQKIARHLRRRFASQGSIVIRVALLRKGGD